MGYSCTRAAGDTLDALQNLFAFNGSCNVFKAVPGPAFFHEHGPENRDGAVTGQVFKMVDETNCYKHGYFRIEPSGKISRFPGLPKRFWAEVEAKAARGEAHKGWKGSAI